MSDALQKFGQSVAVKAGWMFVKIIAGAFISGSIAMGVGYIRDMRDDIRSSKQQLFEQDRKQTQLESRFDSMKSVSDQTVLTLQRLADQLNTNTTDIAVIKAQDKVDAISTRPKR